MIVALFDMLSGRFDAYDKRSKQIDAALARKWRRLYQPKQNNDGAPDTGKQGKGRAKHNGIKPQQA